MNKNKCKLTTKNYKKKGYDHYYLIKREKKFTIEKKDGSEKIYDCNGNYEGEMD